MKFVFIEEQRKTYPVRLMCRVLGVSSSGYYAWRKRGPSERDRANEALLPEIQTVYENSRCTYGSPRIQAELRAQGIQPEPGSPSNAQDWPESTLSSPLSRHHTGKR